MANKRSSISANLRADATGWKKGCDTARAETAKLKRDTENTKINGPSFGGLKRSFTEINSRATAARNTAEAFTNAVNKPAAANAWYQDLKDGLAAVMGDADKASKHMGDLRLISDEQSLSDDQLELITEYSIRLQSLGHSAEFSAEFIREMANAGEWMGRGVDDMSGMVDALDKIGQSGETSLKSIMALTKETPALRAVLEGAFGTDNAKELEDMALSAQELTDGLLRGMKSIETARPDKKEEWLGIEPRKKQWMGADSADNNGSLPDRSPAAPFDAAAMLAERRAKQEIADREKVNQLLRDEVAIDESIRDIELARAEGDEKMVARLEDNEEKFKRILELKEKGLKIDRDQAEAIERIIAARRADKEAVEAAAAAKGMKEGMAELDAAGLRHMGRNRQADKLEDKEKVDKLVAGGLDRKSAEFMVDKERDLAEDEKLGPGRRRIRQKKTAPEIPKAGEREAVKIPQGKKAEAAAAEDKGIGGKAAMNVLERIEENTRKTAAEQQQPAKRR